MAERTPSDIWMEATPWTVPDDQHGWRGLGAPGNRKRKWYTLLYNDSVLVTALLTAPGETSVRHSHGSGELSINYIDNRPNIHWNPANVPHAGIRQPTPAQELDERVRGALSRVHGQNPDIAELLSTILQQQIDFNGRLEALTRPQPGLRFALDVLFPPFTTTIDDPAYPEKRTVVGQWYD